MKTPITKLTKKIKGLMIISILFISITCHAYTWNSFCPDSVNVNNICFNVCGHDVICASNGIYVNIGGGWNFYTHGGLPVWEAVAIDYTNFLLVMGNGSFSDGIYKFNLATLQFTIVESCLNPAFIKFNPNNNLYYVGCRYIGMLYSADGIQWDTVPYFVNKGAAAMDFFNNHITVIQVNNISGVYYSNDNGTTWNQSSSYFISDIAYDINGKLYGIFPGISNSSGLYSSSNYGATWSYEQLSLSMNTVGFDVLGNVFVGWHTSVGYDKGIGVYDTLLHSFTFLNNGLPNKNINKIKYNSILSSITIYCCTDSGVYYSNDYYTTVGINDITSNQKYSLSNYPNPFNSSTTIEYTINENIKTPVIINIYDSKGALVKEFRNLESSKGKHSLAFDASSLNAGVYYYKLNTDNNSEFKKMICYK